MPRLIDDAGRLALFVGIAEDKTILPAVCHEPLPLVNPWNPLPEDYACTLTSLSNGHSVDERCYPDLQAMLDACREAGSSGKAKASAKAIMASTNA